VNGRVLPLDWLEEEDPGSAAVVDEEAELEELEALDVVVVPEALVVLGVPVLVEVDEVVDELVGVLLLDPLWPPWPASGSTYCEFPAEPPPPPPPATAGPALRSVNPAAARRQAIDRARNRVGAGIDFLLNQPPGPRVFRPR
jgi:hypothetical protein